MKEAGALLEQDLTKHPYFVINQKGMEALWEAITASDTINNARELLSDAEKNLGDLGTKALEYRREWGKRYDDYTGVIKGILQGRNSRGFDWISYIKGLDGFWKQKRVDAESEVENALSYAQSLLDEMYPQVRAVLLMAPYAAGDFAAVAACGGDIVLAVKTYEEKIAKLAGSKGTISSGFGKLEQERRGNEEGYDALQGGKSLASRVEETMHQPWLVARDWVWLAERCTDDSILNLGAENWWLPWEVDLPAQ